MGAKIDVMRSFDPRKEKRTVADENEGALSLKMARHSTSSTLKQQHNVVRMRSESKRTITRRPLTPTPIFGDNLRPSQRVHRTKKSTRRVGCANDVELRSARRT